MLVGDFNDGVATIHSSVLDRRCRYVAGTGVPLAWVPQQGKASALSVAVRPSRNRGRCDAVPPFSIKLRQSWGEAARSGCLAGLTLEKTMAARYLDGYRGVA